MYDLLRLLDTPTVQRRVSNFLANLSEVSKRFDEEFLSPVSFGWGSQWKLEDGVYTLTLPVDKNATAKDVDVELENGIVKVKYEFKTEASESSFTFVENLPEDADDETLEATVEDGNLEITVEQKPEAEEEDEVEVDYYEDLVNVPIKRK